MFCNILLFTFLSKEENWWNKTCTNFNLIDICKVIDIRRVLLFAYCRKNCHLISIDNNYLGWEESIRNVFTFPIFCQKFSIITLSWKFLKNNHDTFFVAQKRIRVSNNRRESLKSSVSGGTGKSVYLRPSEWQVDGMNCTVNDVIRVYSSLSELKRIHQKDKLNHTRGERGE